MKAPSIDLAELLHSLSPAEKRHFKISAPYADSQYLKLFDLILESQPYDEAKLIEILKEQGLSLSLPVAKRQLYFQVLEDLVNSQRARIDSSLRKEVDYVQLLLERGFTQQAQKLLYRNKKKTQHYELHRLLLDYLELEKRILGSRVSKAELHNLFEEERACMEALHNENQYWHLAAQIGRLQWQYQRLQGPEQRQALEEWAQDPLLQSVDNAQTLQSKIYYFRAKATYHFTLGQADEAYHLNAQLLKLIETSDYYQKQFPETYLLTFNNFLIDSLLLEKFDALEQGIQKLTTLHRAPALKGIKNLEARIFRQRYTLEVNWYLATGNTQKGLTCIPAIEAGLEKFGDKIVKPHRVTLRYLAAYVLFLNKDYSAAQNWLHKLLQDKDDVVQEVFSFARILNILVHFELNNWEHLAYLMLSARRYIRQRRALYEIEKVLFRYLQKYINLPASPARQSLNAEFRTQVEALRNKPDEQRFFNYIDLQSWLD
ncbi:MAG: hypothetical protein KDC44_24190 [Phaeodactylibacter sp.]|nr:hypothetical protein [Phaeodactylibacter sp.]